MRSIAFLLAWRNLWRHKRRTWLTLGAMIFSNVLLIFMITLQIGSYGMMIDNSLRAFTGHIQVQSAGYLDDPKMRKTIADIEVLAADIRTLLGIETVTARATGFAMASSEERSFGIMITGVEAEHEGKVSSLPGLVVEGDYLSSDSINQIVIGEVLARNLKVEVGDELTLMGSAIDGSVAAALVTVGGILRSGMIDLDRSMAQIRLQDFQEIFAMPGAGHAVVISSPDLATVAVWQKKIADHLNNDALSVLNWDSLMPGLRQAIQADISSAMFMYVVLVILVAFSVLNTQLMSVLERTREFGIALALGFQPARLSRLIMLETGMMAGMGLLLGLGLGFLLALYFSVYGFTYPGMEEMGQKFNIPSKIYPGVYWYTLVPGPLVVFFGSLLAAVYPALRIFKLQPVAAMRAV